jgi:two-component system sensor histidine kinase/response regulator
LGGCELNPDTILESIGDAIYSVTADWSVIFFNRQAELFFERSRTDVIGRSLWDSFPAARDSELGDGLRRVMETRRPLDIVTQSPSTGRWADIRIFPLEDGGIVASWRDVTAQKRQEAALDEAIQNQDRLVRQMRTLTDHVPAMIAHWGSDLKCRFANSSYIEWFGRSSAEMLGISMQELMGETLFAKNEPYIRAALAGHRQSFERTLEKPSGEIGHTWAQYIPDIESEDRVAGFYALVTDVTPLKEAEQLLVEVNVQLKAARDEAEAAAAVKSAFLSNMSHELRNPLTSIIGYVDLLSKRGSLGGMERKYLARIQEAGDALLTTVNDLLDFSKLEAGQVAIERRHIDPVAIGLRALEMFEPAFEKKGLAYRFEAVDAPARVLADDTRIRQILLNLIGNAVKFTASGSVSVRCVYEPAGQMLRYEVIDTGAGIPAERQSRLFQRFSQLDASPTRTFGGTGLGLAICKGLAEAMDGNVGVQSIPGEGSCFWVEIPAKSVDLEMVQQRDVAQVLPEPDALRGLRLLVVDDEPANRELVRLIGEPFGVRVTEAGSGAEAVSAARSEPFDVILMDIRMPEIDGPTAAQIIHSKPGRNASTPMIAFTAEVTGEMPAAWKPVFNGVLQKPIDPADLVHLLATSRPGGQSGPAESSEPGPG